MSVTTAQCKQAIVDWIRKNPGHVASQFVDVPPNEVTSFEKPSLQLSNWKRESKEKVYGDHSKTERLFDCRPYGDQLRAYVVDDGHTILSVLVQGE